MEPTGTPGYGLLPVGDKESFFVSLNIGNLDAALATVDTSTPRKDSLISRCKFLSIEEQHILICLELHLMLQSVRKSG